MKGLKQYSQSPPGVSKQRVHIPLAASDESKTKNFTLKAGESEEKITYEIKIIYQYEITETQIEKNKVQKLNGKCN